MPLTGIDLMKAKGVGSPTAGDTFRDDIVNVDGANGREYVLDGAVLGGSPPVIDNPGGYGENVTFSVTYTFTAGSRWNEIRKGTAAAWAFSVDEATAEATVDSYTYYSTYDALVVRIKGKRTATPSAGTPSTVSDFATGDNPAPVTFTAVLIGLTTSGQTLLTITPQFTPDNLNPFNDQIIFSGSGRYQGYFNNRGYDQDADFDYQWRTGASGGGVLLSTNRVFYLTYDAANEVYPTNQNGLVAGESINTIYLRWRIKPSSGGNGTWNEYGTVNHTDPRNDI